jgi:GNAT superfamily N-acetyltransferase
MPLVRAALAEDAAVLAEFNAAMARETEDRELDLRLLGSGVERALSDPTRGRYWVAEVEGRIVGCLLVTVEWSDWRDGWFWWIQSVYVAPAWRGIGVYGALHEHVRNLARAAGDVVGIRLYVDRENSRAQRTYRRYGMLETGYLLFEETL